MIKWIWKRLRTWFQRFGQTRSVYRARRVSDLPDRLENGEVYVIGDGEYDWSAAMLCPCGCGNVLEMNLLPDAKPVWSITVGPDQSVTLHPSVWKKTGCRSHFFLRNGTVEWV